MNISAIDVLVGEGCENFSARQITLRDLVTTLANVISFNDIGRSIGWDGDDAEFLTPAFVPLDLLLMFLLF